MMATSRLTGQIIGAVLVATQFRLIGTASVTPFFTAAAIAGSILANAGQACVAGSRLIAHALVAERLVDAIIAREHIDLLVTRDIFPLSESFAAVRRAVDREGEHANKLAQIFNCA